MSVGTETKGKIPIRYTVSGMTRAVCTRTHMYFSLRPRASLAFVLKALLPILKDPSSSYTLTYLLRHIVVAFQQSLSIILPSYLDRRQ